MKTKVINKILQQRKKYTSLKVDRNSSTHLIRKALSGSDETEEFEHLSFMLSLTVRFFRDDIIATVVYFDSTR